MTATRLIASDRLFTTLTDELATRAAQATVSQTGPASRALLQHLLGVLAAAPGSGASFLAPPMFEALFDWERHPDPLAAVPFLERALVAAMDDPPASLSKYRFERTQQPFLHQFLAWNTLNTAPARSVIVRTGTGSGKTECFLVPILNDLAREIREKGTGTPLVGVRALFLYPLNALINSQRERLLAWTHAFRGAIRFALYNGATPETVPERLQRESLAEVLSRKTLRSMPPPILVTNATMLEYMMVRASDAPIVDQSTGLLRWIVLDEAHTYLGSSAAEVSLLLRRVMHAFGADERNVRFIATSATMGGLDAEAKLRTFLAQLAGIAEDQVTVIGGRRIVPSLPAELNDANDPLPKADELGALDGEALFRRLARVPAVRKLRQTLGSPAEGKETLLLPAIGDALLGSTADAGHHSERTKQTLSLLDSCATAELSGVSLLPLRAHYFLRTQSGLWACADSSCAAKSGTELVGPAQAMAVSQVMGLPMEQASRELAMLLEGRAGAHNVLGMRLAGLAGERAEAFNKLTAADRLASVRTELEKFAPAIEAYSHSFEGLSSTLVDNAKRFLSLATTPIFDRIKGVLSDANSWFDDNQDKVTLWASVLGERLGSAFDFARDKIRAWWPEIEAFAEHAYDRIASIWHRVGPLVEKVADSAAKALGNDKTFDRLEQIGLLYAGMKGGSLLSGLVPSLPALGGLDRLVRSTGIAGQVAPEGSAFDPMAGRFRDMASGQFAAGEAGGLLELLADPVTIGAAAAAAAVLVSALVATAGALHALGDETSSFHDFAVYLWTDIEARAGGTMDALGQAWHDLEPWLLRAADNAGVQLLEAIRLLAMGAEYAAHVVEHASHLLAGALDWLGIEGEQGHTTRRNAAAPVRHVAESVLRDVLGAHVKVGGGGGGGGVHVDRVEITISSNQDPNRVARVVAGHLADLARYRKSSPYVPNFSASR